MGGYGKGERKIDRKNCEEQVCRFTTLEKDSRYARSIMGAKMATETGQEVKKQQKWVLTGNFFNSHLSLGNCTVEL